MDGGLLGRAHLEEAHGNPALGDLPRGLAAGEAGPDDGDGGRRHGASASKKQRKRAIPGG
jgi:hypothetical protein